MNLTEAQDNVSLYLNDQQRVRWPLLSVNFALKTACNSIILNMSNNGIDLFDEYLDTATNSDGYIDLNAIGSGNIKNVFRNQGSSRSLIPRVKASSGQFYAKFGGALELQYLPEYELPASPTDNLFVVSNTNMAYLATLKAAELLSPVDSEAITGLDKQISRLENDIMGGLVGNQINGSVSIMDTTFMQGGQNLAYIMRRNGLQLVYLQ